MDQDEAARVRALGEIAAEFDLDAIRVRTGDTEIEIVRRDASAYAAAPAAAGAPPAFPLQALVQSAGGPEAPGRTAGANVRKVTAPVVGVFYRAPAPGADPFVEVGSRVNVGDPLCILEAMKLMNEINTDHAGVVTNVLAENGDLVSLGQELFWIEP